MGELFGTFGISWKLLLMQGVNFGILLAILWRYLYRPVIKMIDERREKIAEGVRTAQAAERRLEEAKIEGDQLVGTAAREAESLVAAARTRAEEKGGEIVHAAEARAGSILDDAQARAEEAKRQALAASQKDIARAAMLAAEKILAQKHA